MEKRAYSSNLVEQLSELSILLQAYAKVEENQGGPGGDGETTEQFCVNLYNNLTELQREIRSGCYEPRTLRRAWLDKRDGGLRPLAIPSVRDRVAQTAAHIVLTPILDPTFEQASFAYRPGRSVKQAIERIVALRDEGYRWVVDADIDDYFQRIPHEELLEFLRVHVDEPKFLVLLQKWLESAVEDEAPTRRGLAQGSPISPILSNLYLDRLDEEFARRDQRLIRFADDFVVLCRTRPGARSALRLTRKVLTSLRLRLNREDTRITDFKSGFKFLGVQFLRDLAFRPADMSPQVVPFPPREPQRQRKAATGFGKALKEAISSPSATATSPKSESRRATSAARYDPVLRTLYLIRQGLELRRESRRLKVVEADRVVEEIPVAKLDQVVVQGNISITTPAIRLCFFANVPVYWLTRNGRYLGAAEPMHSRQLDLLHHQAVRLDDPTFGVEMGRSFIRGKIANGRALLQRYQRRNPSKSLARAIRAMKEILSKLASVDDLERLRGLEGAAAAAYLSAWSGLGAEAWDFKKRRRRPPPDPVNSLLSYGYTLLYHNVYSLLRSIGLHPGLGFTHSLRNDHAGLASDMVEEFRAPIVDSTILTLIRRNRFAVEDLSFPRIREGLVVSGAGPAAVSSRHWKPPSIALRITPTPQRVAIIAGLLLCNAEDWQKRSWKAQRLMNHS